MKNFIKNVFMGICIGAGAILPGISSGVLCVIFGIYDKLVKSVLEIFKDFKKNFSFLLPIALGVFVGVVLLGNVLTMLFESYPMQTKYAFIGLILGSVPLLIKNIQKKHTFKINYLIFAMLSFVIGIVMVILENMGIFENNVQINTSMVSIYNIIFLVIVGFFMSIGIVVPGVSSTLILMCFGIYDVYLKAVANLNLVVLAPLAIGVIIGSILFLKIIKYLLNNYYVQTFYAIIGFTVGSIFVLYTPITFDFTGFVCLLLFITCFFMAGLFKEN